MRLVCPSHPHTYSVLNLIDIGSIESRPPGLLPSMIDLCSYCLLGAAESVTRSELLVGYVRCRLWLVERGPAA